MEGQEEEEEEEWLLESLRLYNDLHVFELQDPTRVIEWTGEKSVCVAGYEDRKKNEVLQLVLPQRLYAKENQGLCPERDFKVERGGFSDRPVYRLKHVPGTSLLVTSGPPNSTLQLWRMELDGTDIIKPLGSIPTMLGAEDGWARIATAFSKPTQILHGLRVSNIQVTDIESKQTLFVAASPSNEEISALDFLGEATVLACSANGQLLLADIRDPQSLLGAVGHIPESLATGDERWCAGVRQSPLDYSAADEPLIAQLSSGGHVVLRDLRNTASPLAVARCCVLKPGLHGAHFLAVSFAPLLRGCLSVSGFDGTVHIYDTRNWDTSAQEAKPLFLHKGHIFSTTGSTSHPPLVTTHTWHPSKAQTLLSAANDGSLHVWDWSDPRGVS